MKEVIELLADISDGVLTIKRKDGDAISVITNDDSPAIEIVEFGCTGDAVKACQALLNCHGAKLVVDGIFGNLTQTALMNITGSSVCNLPEWIILIKGDNTNDNQ